MTIKNFLFIFLSLYAIQSYGMEKKNNIPTIKPEHQERKHTENRPVRKLYSASITSLCQILNQSNHIPLKSNQKESALPSLEEDIQALKDCYSEGEIWSEDDLNAYNDGKKMIELLKKQTQ